MRVIQIIDSLEIGGAERMAVNYANALCGKVEFSGLVATRSEGLLLEQLAENVSYLFLNKKKSVDVKAIFRLRDFVKSNNVKIIHAHSSSFFTAVLTKLIYPKIKIVWHDHFGLRMNQSTKDNKVLISLSFLFSSIFVVNRQLESWSKKNMYCKNVAFVPNFVLNSNPSDQKTELKGIDGKRIVFLANLKTPKNHLLILKAFCSLKLFEKDWSLHLIGKDYFDEYSQVIKGFIQQNHLEKNVHLYGTKSDVSYILSQASIGVLASTYEGFPVILIEYGRAGLSVLSTNVGFCSEIIKNEESGLLFDPLVEQDLIDKFQKITNSESLRESLSSNLKKEIERYYEEEVIKKVLLEYSKI